MAQQAMKKQLVRFDGGNKCPPEDQRTYAVYLKRNEAILVS
jgi:hypothetical protein